MSQQNLQKLNKVLDNKVGNSTLAVVLDGMPYTYSGSQLFVSKNFNNREENRIEFFIKAKGKDKPIRMISKSAGEALADKIFSYQFCGYDFSKWGNAQQSITFSAIPNSTLNMLFIETPMHNIFRSKVLPLPQLSGIHLRITHGEGLELRLPNIVDIVNKMRISGVNGMIALYGRSLNTRIRNHSHPFYRIREVFVPSMIQFEGLFNPFYEDRILNDTIKSTQIYQALELNRKQINKLGITTSMITNVELSELLGLRALIPFNFPMLMKLLSGQLFSLNSLPLEYPNRNRVVMRLDETNYPGFAAVISEDEYRELSTSDRAIYSKSDSMVTFLLQNQNYIRQKGFKGPFFELIEIFDEITIR